MKEIKTREEAELFIANFKALKLTAGWKQLVDIVTANIEVLRDQILNGFEEETKESIDRKRDKLKAYKEVIETPDMIIRSLEAPKPFEEQSDPYDSVK